MDSANSAGPPGKPTRLPQLRGYLPPLTSMAPSTNSFFDKRHSDLLYSVPQLLQLQPPLDRLPAILGMLQRIPALQPLVAPAPLPAVLPAPVLHDAVPRAETPSSVQDSSDEDGGPVRLVGTDHQLRKRQKVDDPEKPYKCEHEDCTWAFARPSDLRRHTKLHQKPKLECPYYKLDPTCHKNGGAFFRLDVLKRHLRLCHFVSDPDKALPGPDPGWCRVCQRNFRSCREFIDHCVDCAETRPPAVWRDKGDEPKTSVEPGAAQDPPGAARRRPRRAS